MQGSEFSPCLSISFHEAETHSDNCQQCHRGPITMLWARWGQGTHPVTMWCGAAKALALSHSGDTARGPAACW